MHFFVTTFFGCHPPAEGRQQVRKLPNSTWHTAGRLVCATNLGNMESYQTITKTLVQWHMSLRHMSVDDIDTICPRMVSHENNGEFLGAMPSCKGNGLAGCQAKLQGC